VLKGIPSFQWQLWNGCPFYYPSQKRALLFRPEYKHHTHYCGGGGKRKIAMCVQSARKGAEWVRTDPRACSMRRTDVAARDHLRSCTWWMICETMAVAASGV